MHHLTQKILVHNMVLMMPFFHLFMPKSLGDNRAFPRRKCREMDDSVIARYLPRMIRGGFGLADQMRDNAIHHGDDLLIPRPAVMPRIPEEETDPLDRSCCFGNPVTPERIPFFCWAIHPRLCGSVGRAAIALRQYVQVSRFFSADGRKLADFCHGLCIRFNGAIVAGESRNTSVDFDLPLRVKKN